MVDDTPIGFLGTREGKGCIELGQPARAAGEKALVLFRQVDERVIKGHRLAVVLAEEAPNKTLGSIGAGPQERRPGRRRRGSAGQKQPSLPDGQG